MTPARPPIKISSAQIKAVSINKQTNKQIDRQTDKQTNICVRISRRWLQWVKRWAWQVGRLGGWQNLLLLLVFGLRPCFHSICAVCVGDLLIIVTHPRLRKSSFPPPPNFPLVGVASGGGIFWGD